MGVPSSAVYVKYTANGATTVFAYPFKLQSSAQLDVLVDDVIQVSGFTVSGIGADVGGNVTFSVAPVNGAIVYLRRSSDMDRDTTYNESNFLVGTVNDDQDYQTMLVQEVNDKADRSFHVEQGVAASTLVPPPQANYLLGWNSGGNALVNIQALSGTLSNVDYKFSSVSAMSAQTGMTNGALAQTFGYYTANDGGHGQYIYDSTSVATANGGNVITASGGGRWLLLNDGTINVRQFGAKGDGTGDDSSGIQAAMNYASTNKKRLYIPPGTYLLNGNRQGSYSAILLYSDNLTMIGSGYHSVLKVADNYTSGGQYSIMATASSVTFASNIEIAGIRFDGNGLNNLVIDSGANIRQAYMIKGVGGSNIYIHDNWFFNCPGRAALNLGHSGTPDFSSVRIENNHIRDIGGGIVGNDKQNDCSAIYLFADGAVVANNLFENTTQPSAQTPTARSVVALEIHGRNTVVSNNIIKNFTGVGNAAAQVHDGYNNSWINNKCYGITSNGIVLWSVSPYTNKRLTISGNTIEIDNATYLGGSAIYQSPQTGTTTSEVEDLRIEDNNIYATVSTQQAVTWHGVALCSVNKASIRRNTFINMQGDGVNFEPAVNNLNVRNIDIEDNRFVDCGIHSSANRIWAVYVKNDLTTRDFSNINIRRNFIKRTLQGVGVTPYGIRGINIVGGGYLYNIEIYDNKFENILRTNRYAFNTTTNNINVAVKPSEIPNASTSDPVFGFWTNGQEYVTHTDQVAGGSIGKIATTSGSAVSGVWAATTAYVQGQWVRTSANKILVCTAAGTSSGVEPSPTTLGIQLSDGTCNWVYLDTVVAVFTGFGAINLSGTATYDPPSLADGAGATTAVTVTGAALGDLAVASFSLDLQGITVTAWVSTANTVSVRFQNESGGVLDLASGTLKARVFK